MSDARIQQFESRLGDIENERGFTLDEKEEAEATIRAANELLTQLDEEEEELREKINHEPFDEAV